MHAVGSLEEQKKHPQPVSRQNRSPKKRNPFIWTNGTWIAAAFDLFDPDIALADYELTELEDQK